jgi:WD repeat and SOF domain-containing protein 1
MVSSVYLPRANGHPKNGTALPQYSESSAIQEKLGRRHHPPWLLPLSIPIPGLPQRFSRLWVVNPRRIHHFTTIRFGQRRGSAILAFVVLTIMFTTFALAKRFATNEKKWPTPFTGDLPTLVYKREDLQRIWRWEIESGHYPSRRSSKFQLSYSSGEEILNPFSSRTTSYENYSEQPIASSSESIHTFKI